MQSHKVAWHLNILLLRSETPKKWDSYSRNKLLLLNNNVSTITKKRDSTIFCVIQSNIENVAWNLGTLCHTKNLWMTGRGISTIYSSIVIHAIIVMQSKFICVASQHIILSIAVHTILSCRANLFAWHLNLLFLRRKTTKLWDSTFVSLTLNDIRSETPKIWDSYSRNKLLLLNDIRRISTKQNILLLSCRALSVLHTRFKDFLCHSEQRWKRCVESQPITLTKQNILLLSCRATKWRGISTTYSCEE